MKKESTNSDMLSALIELQVGLRNRHLEVKGDGNWRQMIETVLLLIDQQQPLFDRIEKLGQRTKAMEIELARLQHVGRMVVDSDYRKVQLGADTEETIDAAVCILRNELNGGPQQVDEIVVDRLALYLLNDRRRKNELNPADSLNYLSSLGRKEWRSKARELLRVMYGIEE